MADSAVAVTAGSGTNIDTRTEATNGNHRQVVVLGDPSTNAGVAPVDATNGLKVDSATVVTALAAGIKLLDSGGTNKAAIDAHGSQQTTVSDSSGNLITSTGNALDVNIKSGANANGQTTMASSSPVVLASNQSTIVTAADTSLLGNGASGTTLAPKYATISCSSSGANTIITPTAGKKVKVLQWIVTTNAAVNFKWQTQTGPTDLTGLFYSAGQGGGAGGSYNPVGHFVTSTNSDTLILNLSGAVAVGGSLVYVEV